MTAVARSIGEGVVPGTEKVEAVISSARRAYGITGEFETTETVINDLLARVLANEFLDAKRREELSTKLLAVKAERREMADKQPGQPSRIPSSRSEPLALALAAAGLSAAFLTVLTTRVLFGRVGVDSYEAERYQRLARQMVAATAGLTLIVFITWIVSLVIREPEVVRRWFGQ